MEKDIKYFIIVKKAFLYKDALLEFYNLSLELLKVQSS